MNRSSSLPFLIDSYPTNRRLYKTKMCSFHLNGSCERGRFCTYAHSSEELNATTQRGYDVWEPETYSGTDSYTDATYWSDPTPIMSRQLSPCISSTHDNNLITVDDLLPTLTFLGEQVNELRDEIQRRNALIMALLKLLTDKHTSDVSLSSGESPLTCDNLFGLFSDLGGNFSPF